MTQNKFVKGLIYIRYVVISNLNPETDCPGEIYLDFCQALRANHETEPQSAHDNSRSLGYSNDCSDIRIPNLLTYLLHGAESFLRS